ncbi:MAG: hypothetical protein QM744_09485 [Mesorhizobium sp.]
MRRRRIRIDLSSRALSVLAPIRQHINERIPNLARRLQRATVPTIGYHPTALHRQPIQLPRKSHRKATHPLHERRAILCFHD